MNGYRCDNLDCVYFDFSTIHSRSWDTYATVTTEIARNAFAANIVDIEQIAARENYEGLSDRCVA